MKVYALVGKSGTGKSYQAINLCRDRDIESIIDDGLFICRGKAMAGKSAKREATKIGAIKTALFTDEKHYLQTLAKIKEIQPESVLIIGTSDGMVEKIAKRLELAPIDEKIYIEDITTENERKIAEKQRKGQGKHVIPVSSVQIKHQFSGYFLSPLRIFKGIGAGKGSFTEKSVVRPTYSYMGDFMIAERVIGDIVKCTAMGIKGVRDVTKVFYDNSVDELVINVGLVMRRGYSVIEAARELQKKSANMIVEMTAFNISEMNIEVRGIV